MQYFFNLRFLMTLTVTPILHLPVVIHHRHFLQIPLILLKFVTKSANVNIVYSYFIMGPDRRGPDRLGTDRLWAGSTWDRIGLGTERPDTISTRQQFLTLFANSIYTVKICHKILQCQYSLFIFYYGAGSTQGRIDGLGTERPDTISTRQQFLYLDQT